MGVDYSASLATGFEITTEELWERFGRHISEKSHQEDRYDPKNGKLVGQAKVVDREAGRYLVWAGDDCEDPRELIELICDKVGCSYHENGSYYEDSDDMGFVLGPSLPVDEEGRHEGRVDVGGGVPFKELIKLGPELERIRLELKEMGLDPGDARVMAVLLVY